MESILKTVFYPYNLIQTADICLLYRPQYKCTKSHMTIKIQNSKRLGYAPNNVTPYMHCLVYHAPYFIEKHGSLRPFSGQAVEKTNDVVK